MAWQCQGSQGSSSSVRAIKPESHLARQAPTGKTLCLCACRARTGWDDMFSRICMIGQESAAVAKAIKKELAA